MACELRSGENFLRFSYFRHFAEDEANGNPYNFFFTVRVSSDGFSGHTRWECDRKEFVKFVQSLQDLYDFRTSSAELNDIGYGSRVRFEADKTGHITLTGTRTHMPASIRGSWRLLSCDGCCGAPSRG